jgi:hypothetical protein
LNTSVVELSPTFPTGYGNILILRLPVLCVHMPSFRLGGGGGSDPLLRLSNSFWPLMNERIDVITHLIDRGLLEMLVVAQLV